MAKQKTDETPDGPLPGEPIQAEPIQTEAVQVEPIYDVAVHSVDEMNGVVVLATSAPDGTGFTVSIGGERVEAEARNGLVWFYAGRGIGPAPLIEIL